MVLIDFGAEYHHYKADYTRTWCLSTPSPLFQKIEKVVDQAYKAALKLITQSSIRLTASNIDHIARKIITEAGFGRNFIHTTGHGIGLDAHEPPSLNPANNQELKPNMVITIEPGIYIPGKFGYRFENTLILT